MLPRPDLPASLIRPACSRPSTCLIEGLDLAPLFS